MTSPSLNVAASNLENSLVVFAVAFSHDRTKLYSADNFGRLCWWNVTAELSPSDSQAVGGVSVYEDSIGRKLQAHDNPIYSLSIANNLLATGADEQIGLWRTDSESVQKVAEFTIPQQQGTRGALAPVAETNGICLSSDAKILYAASGDNNAYAWDLETETQTSKFSGHSDYLHCVEYMPRSGLVATGSEDGTVKLWDNRSKSCVSTMYLDRNESGSSPSSRVTCLSVDADENWMVFGGHDPKGAVASLCHLSSRVNSASCSSSSDCSSFQAVEFVNDSIVAVGDSHLLHYYTKDLGSEVVSISSSSSSLYGLCASVDKNGRGLLAASGASSSIDMYTDLRSLAYTYDASAL